MSGISGSLRAAIGVALLTALLTSLTIRAQDRGESLLEPNEPSPATRHAQVIAHGTMPMPAAEVGWRATTERALPPNRAVAVEQAAGFLLAHEGAIALTDVRGATLARLAPGEAVWIDDGDALAVNSLEKKSVDYVEIALLPASRLGEGGFSVAIGMPFAAPPGEAFDVDLIGDALERNEETLIPAGSAPSLLLVTDGAVWVTAGGGAAAQVTAGGMGQIEGEAVIAGGSRSPAAFVVARIGAALPAQMGPQDAAAATPVAGGTTAAMPEPGTDRLWPESTPDDPVLDFDEDGLTDGDESTLYGTEPRDPDTDDDGLDDTAEMLVHGTNPFLGDTDGDGIADNVEIDAGTDPLDVASVPAESSPTPETTPGVDAAVSSPAPDARLEPDGDRDGDGLANADETGLHGTDPETVDTDGDLFSDGGEVVSGRNPLDPADGS